MSPRARPTRPAKRPAKAARGAKEKRAVKDARGEKGRGQKGRGDARVAPYTREVIARLRREYPNPRTELQYRNAFELLVATILSAQTTDVRVNMVSPQLFARYPTPQALAEADSAELEAIIRSTGFYHSKAKSLIGMARALMERFGGVVPCLMEDLITLPGVGRKTANVVLGNACGRNDGIVVDTHVARLSARLGLTTETDPVKIEQALMQIVPREDWTIFSHLLIFHGRRVCSARNPAHDRCVLVDICPSADRV